VTLDQQDPNSVAVLLGNGNGTFKPPVFYPVGQGATSVAVGDLRRNGINDLVVTNGDDNTVSVLLGNGNGTFQPAVNYSMSNNPQVANFPGSVTLASVRNNGRLDIVMSNFGTSNVTVLLGNGDGTFGAPIHVNGGVGANPLAIADFNNDGTPDLLVADQSNDTVNLLAGNGNGTFGAPVQFATGATPIAMAVGNFDGHNLPEVAVLGTSTITVLLNDGGAAPAVAAFASGAGQFEGAGLTSNGTRHALLLTPDEAGIRRGVDPGVFTPVSGVEIAGAVDTIGTLQDLPAPNAVGEPAPEDTAAPLLMQDQLNALPWLSKARVIRWAVRTRPISGLPY
jgi:hypothetical protein